MPTPIRKKRTDGQEKSDVRWLRKKVPLRYRPLVGRAEVWRSLNTTDRRAAATRCAALSAELEAEWKDRFDARVRGSVTSGASDISFKRLRALAGVVHAATRDAHAENPGFSLRWAALTGTPDEEQEAEEREFVEQAMFDFLARKNLEMNEADHARFLPMFVEARRQGYADLVRAAKGDFSPSPILQTYPPEEAVRIDFLAAFEFFCENGELKGGLTGPTAKRWRPKIKAFCDFVGHTDLARITTDDGYRWADDLMARRVSRRSVRDVWIASLKATAGFMVERRKLASNPFLGIRIRGVKETNTSNKKGFSDAQAAKILDATLATPSHLTTAETRAARRWLPWICAYSGARVNEITSLLPSDIRQEEETRIWCIYIRPEMTKGAYERVIPIHSHLIDQRLLDYVEERRTAGLPLFYNPKRARGGKNANPQWQKIAERLAEWVRVNLGIVGVKPNHGWRHRFKSVARDVGMHPEVEKFIIGHGGSDDPGEIEKVSLRYGDPWVKTLAKAIDLYPRYRISGLRKPPTPHKRVRRTRAQIATDSQTTPTERKRRQ